MKYLLGSLAAVAAGGVAIAAYNWLLEPFVPDVEIVAMDRKLPDGKTVRVVYLELDDLARVGVTLFAGIPLAMAVHKMAPIIPAPPVK